MKKSVFVFVFVFVLTGCATTRQVQVVRETSRDTLYLSNIQYDSIYVYNQHSSDYLPSLEGGAGGRPDTIYIRDVQREYKYRFLHDTVRVVSIDSIPVIRTVEVVKTERYVPGIYKWSLAISIILVCVFCVFCVIKIKF